MNRTLTLLAAIAIGTLMTAPSFAQDGAVNPHVTGAVWSRAIPPWSLKRLTIATCTRSRSRHWTTSPRSIRKSRVNSPTSQPCSSDEGYLGKHPALGQLCRRQSGLLAEMKADPGRLQRHPTGIRQVGKRSLLGRTSMTQDRRAMTTKLKCGPRPIFCQGLRCT